jgi:hypothetical protein
MQTLTVAAVNCMQVAARVHQACAQLQQRLADYQQQPLAGLAPAGVHPHMHSSSASRGLQQQAGMFGVAAGSWGVHDSASQLERQLQPLRVLLLHEYQQVVQEQCRLQCLQQQPVPYGWEAAAQAAAEQQMQSFAEQQMPLVMELVVKWASMHAG